MYASLPNFIIGFHGCDKSVANDVINGNATLIASQNDFDWLGHGVYFWENNPNRALEYAQMLKEHPERTRGVVNEPAVVGAIIDLGYCLNLFESKSLIIVKEAYELLCSTTDEIPQNKPIKKDSDLLLRYLDCAVFEILHTYNEFQGYRPYDSLRGGFLEGKELYPNAGFKDKNHIQICIRNPNCIKGYFWPLEPDASYPIP